MNFLLTEKDLGLTVMTRGIADAMKEDDDFAKEVHKAFWKYLMGDWGDLCEEDKAMNNRALELGKIRLLAAYNTSKGKIYIITEADRSATTILFSEEY